MTNDIDSHGNFIEVKVVKKFCLIENARDKQKPSMGRPGKLTIKTTGIKQKKHPPMRW